MDNVWQILAKEAGLASGHLSLGVEALNKANYAQQAYYYEAFFALSVGFERSAKLIIIVDYALQNNDKIISWSTLKKYGHDIHSLLQSVDLIAHKRGWEERALPSSKISSAIIQTVSSFAKGNRYYGLDSLCGRPDIKTESDPVASWFSTVVVPILNKHYSEEHRKKDEEKAAFAEELMGSSSLIRHHSELGEDINSYGEASLRTAQIKRATPYVRMYVLQFARYLGYILSKLGDQAMIQQIEDIPVFSDFFAIFNNEDDYFKRRKTWSMYRP